jgi:hypothetical protein
VGARERRLAENETMWRALNEADPPEPGRVAFVFCECGLQECAQQLRISWHAYEAVRADPTTFVVIPGHELPEIETVVRRGPGFVVVAKQGVPAAIAQRDDPRS